MPQHAKGPRLFRRRDTGIYYIRDGARQYSTGSRNSREAAAKLKRYLVERDRPHRPSSPEQLTVAAALDIYGREWAPEVKDPARIGHAINALVPILGSLLVASLTGDTCRNYAAMRGKKHGTIRRELGVLQAALNYCHVEGRLTSPPRIWRPKRPQGRVRWLTRSEVARLLRTAYRNPRWKHLVPFILVGVYTGTRPGAIFPLRFTSSAEDGWVDTANGLLYRRGTDETETAKRRPPIPLPSRLLAHLKRWEANGARYVVEIRGQRVASIKTAWKSLLVAAGINHCRPHDLRHTAITWAMQRGMDIREACGYFGISVEELQLTYWHHHPRLPERCGRSDGSQALRKLCDTTVSTPVNPPKRQQACAQY